MTSSMLLFSLLYISLPLLFCCFDPISIFFQTRPRVLQLTLIIGFGNGCTFLSCILTKVRKQTILLDSPFADWGEIIMDESVQRQIVQFNFLFKQYDDIYRSAAKKFDIPELALWILYALREKPDCWKLWARWGRSFCLSSL